MRHAQRVRQRAWSCQAEPHMGTLFGVVRGVLEAAVCLQGAIPAEKSPETLEVHGVLCEKQGERYPSPGQKCTRREPSQLLPEASPMVMKCRGEML